MFCSKCGKQINEGEKFCVQCGNLLEPVVPVAILPQENVVNSSVSSKSKKDKKSSVNIILLIFVIVFFALAAGLGITAYNFSEERDYYSSEYYEIKRDYVELKEQCEFFDDYARIVPNDYSGKYHRYGCEKLDTDVSFWISNIKAAEDEASPCPYCCPED